MHQIDRSDAHPPGPKARTCNRPDDNASSSRRSSQTGKIFSKIFGISVVQLSVRTAYDHHLDGAQFYQARRSFELLAYK
jgi:hypothetical protein